jgi:2-phospho-L-lactate guanylyltransferase
MTFWAIVPVKPLRRGKSRLAGVLTEDERMVLNQYLLANTLDVLRPIRKIDHILVISRDPQALTLAREHGARTVLEHGMPQLNLALTRATLVARHHGARGVLILPADLPLLTKEDVILMIEKAKSPPVVVIAPDRRRTGTNGLLVYPAGLISYEFGPNSFERHCESARLIGARLEVCELPSLALDMDLPEDLSLVGDELEALNLPVVD